MLLLSVRACARAQAAAPRAADARAARAAWPSETHRKRCLRAKDASGGCAWCVKGFMGSNKCVSETSVKYLPKMVADCEMPKKKDKKSDAVAAS
jgi:hypothetical protein